METLHADAVHASASMHSTLSSIEGQDVDDLTKEKEEELLYGTGEGGDDEEALSDDSLRLKLSDDEAESEDVTLQTISDKQQDKPSTNKSESASKENNQSVDPQKQSLSSSTPVCKNADEKQGTGNVSVNEKVENEQETDDIGEDDPVKSQSSKSNNTWGKIGVSRWRFSTSPRTRSFSHSSRALPSRNCYSMYSEHNRSDSGNNNSRLKGGYTRGKRGRPRIHPYDKEQPSDKKDKKIKTKQKSCSAPAGNVDSSQETNIVASKNSTPAARLNNMKLDKDKESDRNEVKKAVDKKIETPAVTETQLKSSNESGDVKKDNNDLHIKSENEHAIGDSSKNGKNPIKAEDSDKKDKQNSLSDVCDVYEIVELVKNDTAVCDDVQSKPHNKKQSNITILEIEDSDKVEVIPIKEINSAKDNDSSSVKEPLAKKVLSENKRTNREDELCIENGDTASTENLNVKKIEGNSSNCTSSENDIVSITESNDSKHTTSKTDNNIEPVSRKRTSSPIESPPEKRQNKNTDNKDAVHFQNKEDKIFPKKEDKNLSSRSVIQHTADTKINKIDVNENTKEPSFDAKGEDNKNDRAKPTNDQKSSVCRLDCLGSDATDINVSPNVESKNVEVIAITQRRRRRTKKIILAAQEAAAFSEDKQGRENGRQKRRTAKNAEEIIRKKFLNHDSDAESSDSSDKFIIVNRKMNQDARSLSPPSLKRNYPDSEPATMNGRMKKVKPHSEALKNEVPNKQNRKDIKNLNYVRKFFQRDLKEKLPKLKQEELEELLIQKIVETITMRGEIGKLREQARISERNQEATRTRCQQLAKQIKDFEMVLRRNAEDQRANNGKPTAPIKINRSVGLQVNFMTEHGMQNLRQLQQTSNLKAMVGNGVSTPVSETTNTTPSPRRGIKVRSPRRSEPSVSQSPVMTQSQIQTPALVSTVTPAALVVTKPFESQHTLTVPAAGNNTQQLLSNQQSQQSPQQAIVINGKIPSQTVRSSATINVSKGKPNDLIDLTDEEEKSKTSVAVVTTAGDLNIAPKAQPCFQRVIQAIPGNVAISSQSTSIRVVQPASQPTPTALVNNMNASRVAYVMQSGVGSTRQLIITSNSNPMRPVTSGSRAPFSAVTYKTGISTIANGTVRVLTTPAGHSLQLQKHPAPLPDAPNYAVHPVWKLPPPAPSLKISKVANGIVLSWNMALTEKYADIASYQLYAYQEVSGVPPNTALWKKVGDVRALPLPMACTLTQFSEGNNYYFAVRAVDTHSRKGQYSTPGNISL